MTSSPSRLLVPLGIAACLSLFGDLSLYAGLVTQLDVVHLTLAETGILLSIHRILRIPGNPLAGMLMDRGGRRPLFLLGALLAVLSTAGYGLVSGFWPFLLTRLAWGTAWALINVGGLAMILDISTPATRGRLVGFYNTCLWAGYATGPLMGGFLVDVIGFSRAMLVCAGFSAVGLLVAFVALPETAPQKAAAPANSPIRFDFAPRLLALVQSSKIAIRENPSILTAMTLNAVTMFAGDGVIISTIALILQQRLGKAIGLDGFALGVATASGILISLRSLLAAGTSPLAGHLSDRKYGRIPLIAASVLVGMAGFIILAFAQSLWSVLLGVALSALSGGAAVAVLAALMGDSVPSGRMGAAMGAYATAGDIGSAIGPTLAFSLVPLVGLKLVYLFSALIFAAGLSLLIQQAPLISKVKA
jgi:MFS family permease